jgi:hypothetical protein
MQFIFIKNGKDPYRYSFNNLFIYYYTLGISLKTKNNIFKL